MSRRYSLSCSKVIPLPKWKANPITNPEAIFNKGAVSQAHFVYYLTNIIIFT